MLTKQQKLDAYNYCKEQIPIVHAQRHAVGVCDLLARWTRANRLPLKTFVEDFEEFQDQRPNDAAVFWWPLTPKGDQCRLAALDRAIALTEKLPE